MNTITKIYILSLIVAFAAIIFVGIFSIKDNTPTKEYPVRVYLCGEWNNSFDCDSANLNFAWKDGVKIQLKNVYQIKFN